MPLLRRIALPLASFAVAAAVSCSSSTSPPSGAPTGDDDSGAQPGDSGTPLTDSGTDASAIPGDVAAQLTGCTLDPGPGTTTFDPKSNLDPIGAKNFTLAMALNGFPQASGKLVALISTEKSYIRCELSEADAPISVANFVGLARGTRPYNLGDEKGWKVGRFFDGLLWHRVIPDFVIQGGDPDGDGTGGPGYDLVVENQIAEPLGTLAQAASNAPSGSQFYIVVGTGPQPNYNVYGTCATDAAIAIAGVPRDGNDKPTTDIHMQRIDIARCP